MYVAITVLFALRQPPTCVATSTARWCSVCQSWRFVAGGIGPQH